MFELNLMTVIETVCKSNNDLPIYNSDNVKCMDFDLDRTVFKSAQKSSIKLSQVNPYNKTWLEVMDMV